MSVPSFLRHEFQKIHLNFLKKSAGNSFVLVMGEVDRRLAMEREYLYVLALKEWAEAGLSSRTIKTDEAAADKGGCTTDQTQINSE